MDRLYEFIIDRKWTLSYLVIFAALLCSYFLGFEGGYLTWVLDFLGTFAFLLLVGSLHRVIFSCVLILFFLVSIFVFPVHIMYGSVDLGYMTSIFYSNSSEILSYFDVVTSDIYIPIIGLLLYVIFGCVFVKKIKISSFKKISILIFFGFLWSIGYLFGDNNNAIIHTRITPIDNIQKILGLYHEVADGHDKMMNNKDDDSIFRGGFRNIGEKKKKTLVVVVGESVRKDMLHSYGFPFKNTPRIDASPRIQFDEYLSVATQTVPSLTRTLAWSSNGNDPEISNNIFDLAHTIGYDTFWISNQGEVGEYDTPTTMIAKKSKHHFFLNTGSFEQSNHTDNQMLPYLENILNEEPGDGQVIVLHRIGAHVNVCDKIGRIEENIPNQQISCYNQNIKDLDGFLEKIYSLLKNKRESFNLVYFSDHGVKVKKDKIVHGNDIRQAYDVPLLVWGSDINKVQYIKSARIGYDFVYLISEILGGSFPYLKNRYTFLSSDDPYPDKKKIEVLASDGNIKKPRGEFKDEPIKRALVKYGIPFKEE